METDKKQNNDAEEELAAYETLRQRVSKTFGELHDRINRETVSHAMDKAAAELKEVGGHSMEAIGKASAALKKDIASTADHLKPKVDDDGMLRVFINDEQVVAYDGPFGYADDKPEVYFKMGLYRDATPHPMSIIIDDYRRGKSRDEVAAQPN